MFEAKGSDIELEAKRFAEEVSGETVFFPITNKSKRTFQQYLKPTQIVEIETYSTHFEKIYFQEEFDLLIFTSPSNVEAYSSTNQEPSCPVLCIGNTTANYAQKKWPGCNINVSWNSSELALNDGILPLLAPK